MAALAEIVASIAVAVSLILVVVSLNQNTAALQSINDNFLYQLQDSRLSDVSNKDLSEVIAKALAGDQLDSAEQLRFDFWVTRELNMWELAFIRHQEGLMPPSQ